MNRAQRTQEILKLDALARAAKDRAEEHRQILAEEARTELEQQGTAPSWRLLDIGTVSLPVSKETVVVSDPAALLAWVTDRYPTEVETIRQVRASFQTVLLGQMEGVDEDKVIDPETGEIIPGLGLRLGGQPGALTIRASRDAKAAYAAHGLVLLDRALAPPEPMDGEY